MQSFGHLNDSKSTDMVEQDALHSMFHCRGQEGAFAQDSGFETFEEPVKDGYGNQFFQAFPNGSQSSEWHLNNGRLWCFVRLVNFRSFDQVVLWWQSFRGHVQDLYIKPYFDGTAVAVVAVCNFDITQNFCDGSFENLFCFHTDVSALHADDVSMSHYCLNLFLADVEGPAFAEEPASVQKPVFAEINSVQETTHLQFGQFCQDTNGDFWKGQTEKHGRVKGKTKKKQTKKKVKWEQEKLELEHENQRLANKVQTLEQQLLLTASQSMQRKKGREKKKREKGQSSRSDLWQVASVFVPGDDCAVSGFQTMPMASRLLQKNLASWMAVAVPDKVGALTQSACSDPGFLADRGSDRGSFVVLFICSSDRIKSHIEEAVFRFQRLLQARKRRKWRAVFVQASKAVVGQRQRRRWRKALVLSSAVNGFWAALKRQKRRRWKKAVFRAARVYKKVQEAAKRFLGLLKRRKYRNTWRALYDVPPQPAFSLWSQPTIMCIVFQLAVLLKHSTGLGPRRKHRKKKSRKPSPKPKFTGAQAAPWQEAFTVHMRVLETRKVLLFAIRKMADRVRIKRRVVLHLLFKKWQGNVKRDEGKYRMFFEMAVHKKSLRGLCYSEHSLDYVYIKNTCLQLIRLTLVCGMVQKYVDTVFKDRDGFHQVGADASVKELSQLCGTMFDFFCTRSQKDDGVGNGRCPSPGEVWEHSVWRLRKMIVQFSGVMDLKTKWVGSKLARDGTVRNQMAVRFELEVIAVLCNFITRIHTNMVTMKVDVILRKHTFRPNTPFTSYQKLKIICCTYTIDAALKRLRASALNQKDPGQPVPCPNLMQMFEVGHNEPMPPVTRNLSEHSFHALTFEELGQHANELFTRSLGQEYDNKDFLMVFTSIALQTIRNVQLPFVETQ